MIHVRFVQAMKISGYEIVPYPVFSYRKSFLKKGEFPCI